MCVQSIPRSKKMGDLPRFRENLIPKLLTTEQNKGRGCLQEGLTNPAAMLSEWFWRRPRPPHPAVISECHSDCMKGLRKHSRPSPGAALPFCWSPASGTGSPTLKTEPLEEAHTILSSRNNENKCLPSCWAYWVPEATVIFLMVLTDRLLSMFTHLNENAGRERSRKSQTAFWLPYTEASTGAVGGFGRQALQSQMIAPPSKAPLKRATWRPLLGGPLLCSGLRPSRSLLPSHQCSYRPLPIGSAVLLLLGSHLEPLAYP